MQNTDFIPEEKKINKKQFYINKLKLSLILTIAEFNFQNPAQYDSVRTREPILHKKKLTV